MADLPAPAALQPVLARPRGFKLARTLFRTAQRVTTPVRRGYYLDGRGRGAIGLLPSAVRAAVGLDDESAIGSRKIEIGGGPHAQRGYVHVDIDPGAHHLEYRAAAWALPFDDGWATELVAVHSLEHVHPSQLVDTLREWRRVLAPGGHVQVHVPNGPAMFRAFESASVEEKWPIMGSILGMYCGPGLRDPRGLELRSDHQLVLDFDVLRWAFEQAGFSAVEDLTGTVEDRHTAGWRDLVPDYSLIVRATR